MEIQNDSIIGKGTKIQSHTFICAKTTVGELCFIGHGVIFTNDKFHNKKISRSLLPTIIGNNVLIGSNATILPITIFNDVVIGAGSVVTKDILIPGIYAGNPAKKID